MSAPSFPRLVLGGLKSYIPNLSSHTGTGGSTSARYCYSVWMRHLQHARAQGFDLGRGRVVEIGPGDTLGVSLMALLCGASSAVALDAVDHTTAQQNRDALETLVGLLRARTPLPDEHEFPQLRPPAIELGFPHDLLSDEKLSETLSEARIKAIEEDISRLPQDTGPESLLRFVAPWEGRGEIVHKHSADAIIGQAVMEYFDDIHEAYRSMTSLLRPGGIFSMQMDLSSHLLAPTWDGHWAISDFSWRLIRGARPFFPNREPLSRHIKAIEAAGLKIIKLIRYEKAPTTSRWRLAKRFRTMSETDRRTRSAFVLATREAT